MNYISDSQINSFVRCPVAWEFRYVKNIKIRPSWALTGSAAHAAEEANYKQKMETFADLSLSDVRDITAETFEHELKLGDQEIIWDTDEHPGDAKDRTVKGVESYHLNIAPTIQPIMVEEPIELDLPLGTQLRGRIDVVDQHTNIRDTKHVSYKPTPGDDRYQTQPGLYGWAYRALTGIIPKFTFDYIVLGARNRTKATPDAISVETPMTEKRLALAMERAENVETSIRAGVVWPNANPFNCRGCGFRKICKWSAVEE